MKSVFIAVWLIGTAAGAVGSIPLTLRDDSNTTRTNDWVTTGVPLPRGTGVTDVTNLMVTDGSGTVIDSMRTVLSRWGGAPTDGSKEIKWVLLDFRASVASGSTAVYYLKDRAGSDPATSPAVSVTQDSTYITVDTGAGGITAKIRKDKFTLLDSVVLNASGATLVTAGSASDFQVVAGGVTYSSSNAGSYTAAVEYPGNSASVGENMRGQIRVKGSFRDGSSNARCLFDVRLLFYAGSPIVKVQGTYIIDQDSYAWKPSDLAFNLPLNLGSSRTFTSGNTSFAVSGSDDAYLLQDDYNHFAILKGADSQASGTTSTGWVDLSDGTAGATVYMRDMWQNYPNEIEANGLILTAHLWPIHADLVSQVAAKQADAIATYPRQYFPYQKSNLMDLRASTAVVDVAQCGSSTPCILNTDIYIPQNYAARAKTWELMYYFHGPTADPAGASARFQNFLVGMSATQFCTSQTIDRPCAVYDNTSTTYATIPGSTLEGFMDTWFTSMQTVRANIRAYGSWVYGDLSQGGNVAPTSRNWDGCQVNNCAGPLYQFLRTGELKSDSRKYFDFFYATATHNLDVDRDHLDIEIASSAVTGDAVSKQVGSANHTADFGVGHATANSDLLPRSDNAQLGSHQRILALATLYFLTGYGRAYDVALERIYALTNRVTITNSTVYGLPAGRSVGATMDAAITEMDLTGDSTNADAVWAHESTVGQSPAGNHPELEHNARYAIFAEDYNSYTLYGYAVRKNDPTITAGVAAGLMASLAAGPQATSPPSSGTYGYSDAASLSDAGMLYDLTHDPLARNLAWRWLRQIMQTGPNTFANVGAGNTGRVLSKPPLAMAAVKGWNGYVEPKYPIQFSHLKQNIPLDFKARKIADASWTFQLVQDCGFDAAWTCPVVTVDVKDPIGSSVAGYPTTWGLTMPSDINTQQPHGQPDARYQVFTVPADGRVGDYTIEVSESSYASPTSNPNQIAISACSVPKCWLALSSGGNVFNGFWHFFVPDHNSFTVSSPSGFNSFLVKPDSSVVTFFNSSTQTSPQIGDWSVLFYSDGLLAWPLSISGASVTGNFSVSAATNPDFNAPISGHRSGRNFVSGRVN